MRLNDIGPCGSGSRRRCIVDPYMETALQARSSSSARRRTTPSPPAWSASASPVRRAGGGCSLSSVFSLRTRTYVLYWRHARRRTARSRADRAQPGQGDAVRVVAEPVRRLRPPLHVLLRARVRGARRPAVGRPLRPLDPRQDNVAEVLRRELGAPLVGARGGDDRRRNRPVSAGRGALSPHARVHRRARAARARRPRSSRAARSSGATSTCCRRRRPGRGVASTSRCRRSTIASGARPSRARRHPPPARDRPPARRRRHPHERRRRADPARPLRRPEQLAETVAGRARRPARTTSGRTCSTCGPGTREHFLEALARDWPAESARYEALYAGRSYLPRSDDRAGDRAGAPRSPASMRATGGRRCGRAPEPTQLTLV